MAQSGPAMKAVASAVEQWVLPPNGEGSGFQRCGSPGDFQQSGARGGIQEFRKLCWTFPLDELSFPGKARQ